MGFPGGTSGKKICLPMQEIHRWVWSLVLEDPLDKIPASGRSPGEGNGNPLQYSCLENSMDGGALWATVHGGRNSQTQLNNFPFTFTFWIKWQPAPVFLPGEFLQQRSLVGYSPQGCKESGHNWETEHTHKIVPTSVECCVILYVDLRNWFQVPHIGCLSICRS